MSLPLSGLRVVDFAQGGAGPYCGQLLGDYGADVIKVEPPRGDWSRSMGAIDQRVGLSSAYIGMNRNKRGVCLDLSQEDGRALARRLAGSADIVLESFRPGVMERLGLGFEDLRGMNNHLIYCSITGFGSSGPNALRPATDSSMQPYSGLMSINGEAGGPPLRIGNIVSDMTTATDAVSGILLALYRLSVSGEGGLVEVCLLDSSVSFQANTLTEYLVTGVLPARPGNRNPLLATAGVTKGSDGYLAIAVLDHYWQIFCDAISRPELIDDPRFVNNDARVINRIELWKLIDATLAQRSVAEWVAVFLGIGVVCSPVNDYADLVDDPQVLHNELIAECLLDDGSTLPMVRSPVRLSDTGSPRYIAPPRLGQHSRQVLGDLEVTKEEFQRLVDVGAVIDGSD